tara:strand:- start:593 stop:769 length:177 start_codon:yes stop_codon:yes gene_type:complete
VIVLFFNGAYRQGFPNEAVHTHTAFVRPLIDIETGLGSLHHHDQAGKQIENDPVIALC